MRSVKTLALGILLGVASPGLHAQADAATTPAKAARPAQAKPAAQNTAKTNAPAAVAQAKPPSVSATTPAVKAAPAAAKLASQGTKPALAAKPDPAAKTTAKRAAKKPAPKKAPKPAATASAKPAEADKEPKIARRDPFESLVGREQGGSKSGPLPPGKAGLQVSTLRLDGIVRAPNGMIAVVSNPQSRTYFLREGDQLYDGRVEKIAMDGVSFHEIGKDAFGKPVERQVNKRIYASAGEQQ